ncbi:MAG TPA: hypothetical protein VG820_07595 [Fimbriimonadaceae bacterium]|nr:hypothetical protein [Fimbriimonadaceae bacterium]
MRPNRPPDWKSNAFRAYNQVGIVLMILTLPIAYLVASGDVFPNASVWRYAFPAAGLLLWIALTLVRIRSEIWVGERRLRRQVGVWPFLKNTDQPLNATGIEIGAFRNRYGPSYTGKLLMEQGASIPLLVAGSASDVKPLVELGRSLSVPLLPGRDIEQYKPPWLDFQSDV